MEGSLGPAARKHLFSFHGHLSTLFVIHLTNVALTVLTLGIYRFWGKTRMRRYLWSQITIGDDALEYTGTARELFLGFLVVFGAILLPLFLIPEIIRLSTGKDYLMLQGIVKTLQGLIVGILIPIAIYRARRYRLSRTRWRGIRCAQTGSATAYAGRYIGYGFCESLTLGLTIPIYRTRLAQYVWSNTWVGDQAVNFVAVARPMYRKLFQAIGIFVIGILVYVSSLLLLITPLASDSSGVGFLLEMGMMVVAAVISYAALLWYLANEMIYFLRTSSVGGLTFDLTASPWRYVRLLLGNFIIYVATLTLGAPWTYKRMLDFLAEHLWVEGDMDAFITRQSSEPVPSLGEGLADAFDIAGF